MSSQLWSKQTPLLKYYFSIIWGKKYWVGQKLCSSFSTDVWKNSNELLGQPNILKGTHKNDTAPSSGCCSLPALPFLPSSGKGWALSTPHVSAPLHSRPTAPVPPSCLNSPRVHSSTAHTILVWLPKAPISHLPDRAVSCVLMHPWPQTQ